MTIPYEEIRTLEHRIQREIFNLETHYRLTGRDDTPSYVFNTAATIKVLEWLAVNNYNVEQQLQRDAHGVLYARSRVVKERRGYSAFASVTEFRSVHVAVGYALCLVAVRAEENERSRIKQEYVRVANVWKDRELRDELHTCHDACPCHGGEEPPRDFEPIPPRRVYRLQAWLSRRGGMW